MDAIGAFVANLHGILGHDKTAAYLRQSTGNRAECVLCAYENQPDDEHRATVVNALSTAAVGPEETSHEPMHCECGHPNSGNGCGGCAHLVSADLSEETSQP